MSASTISDNAATGFNAIGGGIADFGTLTVSTRTLAGNSAIGAVFDNYAAFGGGIFNDGYLTITNSTLAGTSAFDDGFNSGGGIYNQYTLTMSNSIIASSPSGGDCRFYQPVTSDNAAT